MNGPSDHSFSVRFGNDIRLFSGVYVPVSLILAVQAPPPKVSRSLVQAMNGRTW